MMLAWKHWQVPYRYQNICRLFEAGLPTALDMIFAQA